MKTFEEILSEYYGANDRLNDHELQMELVLNPDLIRIRLSANEFADQFKPKWINVDERLPEKDGDYHCLSVKNEPCVLVIKGGAIKWVAFANGGRYSPGFNTMNINKCKWLSS